MFLIFQPGNTKPGVCSSEMLPSYVCGGSCSSDSTCVGAQKCCSFSGCSGSSTCQDPVNISQGQCVYGGIVYQVRVSLSNWISSLGKQIYNQTHCMLNRSLGKLCNGPLSAITAVHHSCKIGVIWARTIGKLLLQTWGDHLHILVKSNAFRRHIHSFGLTKILYISFWVSGRTKLWTQCLCVLHVYFWQNLWEPYLRTSRMLHRRLSGSPVCCRWSSGTKWSMLSPVFWSRWLLCGNYELPRIRFQNITS